MKITYKQSFVNAASMGDVEKAREALNLGLHKEKDFTFEDPSIFFNILNTRQEEIIRLALDYGCDPDFLFKLATEHNSKIVLCVLSPIVLKNELDEALEHKEKQQKRVKI